jgi:DNA repair exonuclease SbcCD ATPase subunit
MMRLDFESIHLENFKAFGAEQVLRLAERGPGLHFVRGRNLKYPRLGQNGVGKSSLWQALVWCLYGRTMEGLRNPDIRPWLGDKETTVSVGLRLEGRPKRIQRTAYPNRLLINNQVADQDAVEKLIGLSFEAFTHTIVLGQGRPLFFDLPPRDKMELFTDVLPGLERWERRSQLAVEQVREIGAQVFTLTSEEQAHHILLTRNDEMLSSVMREHAAWEAEQVQVERGSRTQIRTLEKRLSIMQRQRDGADLQYDGSMTEFNSLSNQQRQLEGYMGMTSHEIDVKLLEIRGWENERDRYQSQLNHLGDGGACPTCGQSVRGTQLATHRTELKERIRDLKSKIAAGVPNALTSQLEDLQRQLNQVRRDMETYRGKADRANDLMLQLDPQLADIKARLEQLRLARTARAQTHNPFQGQAQNLRRLSRSITVDIDNVKDQIAKLNRQQARRQFWVKGFKEVRLYVIEEILRDLELASNIRLEEFGLIGWSIRYNIDRETQSGTISRALNVTILSPQNRKPVRFESWSGGEGQRLRLVGALALADVLLAHAGVQTQLTILDEPTQHLSMVGINDLVDSLRDWTRYSQRSVFFTDHRVLESRRFTSTLTVTRDQDGVHINGDR